MNALIHDTDFQRRYFTIFPEWQLKTMLMQCVQHPLIKTNDSVLRRFNNQNGRFGHFHEFELRLGKYNRDKRYFNTNIEPRHYNWLMQTLDVSSIPKTYQETVDVIHKDTNIRTTYYLQQTTLTDLQTLLQTNVPLNIQKSIIKHQIDLKNYIQYTPIFGYDFRLSVAFEESVHEPNKIDLKEALKVPNAQFRLKKRHTYTYGNFYIDFTELTDSQSPKSSHYQIEIELKPYQQFVDTHEINVTLLYLLKNLYGLSEII